MGSGMEADEPSSFLPMITEQAIVTRATKTDARNACLRVITTWPFKLEV